MSHHRTPYDEALDAMLAAGISRGRADELLMGVHDQAQVKADEPTFDLRLTRAQVSALLIDGNRERFPTLDSADFTVSLFESAKRWYLDNPATSAPAHWAQIKDNHEGAGWRTVGTSEKSGHDAAWGTLTDDMQRRGLRYGELAAHIADMENGDVLSAEDGTEYRILKPGQEITR